MPVLRCLLTLLLCAAVGRAADLRNLSGKAISGDLVSINDKEGIVLKTKEGATVATPLVNALQLDLAPPPAGKLPPCTRVELSDGSVFYCKPDDGVRVVNKNQVQLTLLSGTQVVAPLATVHIILKDAHDPKMRDHADWPNCLARSKKVPARDVVARRSDDTLNAFRGSFLETGDGTVLKFIREGREAEDAADPRTVDLKDKGLHGIIFAKLANAIVVPTLCRLEDLDQNRLAVAKMELAPGGPLVVTTVTGAKVTYPLQQVARLDFSKGKIEFISDLPREGVPVEVKVEKTTDSDKTTFCIGYNRNFNGERLQLRVVKDGKEQVEQFDHGLFLPAPAQLLYKLNGEFDEFTALLGVDESAKSGGGRITIEADGSVLLTADVSRTAVVIKGRDEKAPRPVERIALNIKDVKELRIKVEPLNPLDIFGSHVNLADAKISKTSK